jgi:large subunit ribosomal protein L34e
MTGKSINSRSKNRKNIRLPGGRLKTSSSGKKPSRTVCPITGKALQAVPQLKGSAIKRLEKSKRRPERPFGGMLSSKAMRILMIDKARKGKND